VVNVLHARLELIQILAITNAHPVVTDALLAVELPPVPLAQSITIYQEALAQLVVMVNMPLLNQPQMCAQLVVMKTVKLVVKPQPLESVLLVMRLSISHQELASLVVMTIVTLALDRELANVLLALPITT